jgi:lysophospholipase L1-like esterase
MVAGSLALALMVAEGGTRLLAPQSLSETLLVQNGAGLWINRPAASIQYVHRDRTGSYRITERHERTPIAKGERTLLLLGDSFAFGWLLPDSAAPHVRLQARLDGAFGSSAWSVRNVATPGWGAGDYVAFVEDQAADYRPDALLVLLNIDDIGRAARSPQWALADSGLVRQTVRRSGWRHRLNTSRAYQALLRHSHVLHLVRSAARRKTGHPVRETSQAQTRRAGRVGEALFGRLAKWSALAGTPVWVSTTGWHEPPYHPASAEPTRRFVSRADSLFEVLGLPYADPSAHVWRQRGRDRQAATIAGDGHPDKTGARLIADAVAPFVIDQIQQAYSDSARVGEGAR